MREFISRRSLPFTEIVALSAFALIAYGTSLLCYPAGWIVGGVLLLLAVVDARE